MHWNILGKEKMRTHSLWAPHAPQVGEALQHALGRGHVQREELFICSKVWNSDHGAARVEAACIHSLAALGLDYLDLYLIHWPVSEGSSGPEVKPPLRETWGAMEALVRRGLVRSIGVSNFSAKKLGEVLTYATIPPAVCQVGAQFGLCLPSCCVLLECTPTPPPLPPKLCCRSRCTLTTATTH
jgi:diketogulonate reductase-like aldo/keto reductase